MSDTSVPAPRVTRPSDSFRRPGPSRRWLAAPLLGLMAAAVLLLTPALASADSASTLTVVGTSDVSDSGLIPNLIQPAFEKAFPQFTFKYIGTATGTAISDAETGSVGASALIVHAASLENQFVANGFSQERWGRALWTNDFVLAGPLSDPASALTNGAHDVVQAVADVAAAGIAGKATFVSRGGTAGTTVEEHQIWGQLAGTALAPTGLLLCTVNATSGGGDTPIAPGNGVTASGQACPSGGALPKGSALPAWYAATGLTQGPNVVASNACSSFKTGDNSCYVFTDRGTYDYLASGTDPAGSIPALKIVTRDDSAIASGGANELINYFHGYIINPAKPGETVNLIAAQDFLSFITSPTIQAQLKTYLATSDPGGPPFKADASPIIANSTLPANYHAGKPVTLTGTVTNAQPGFPAPAQKTVTVDEVVGSLLVPIATGSTSSTGAYTISFTPPATGTYEVTTAQIGLVEDATLTPPFGDLLSPGAGTPAAITVHSAVPKFFVHSQGAKALVIGSVAPGTGHVKGAITILARQAGAKHGFRTVGTAKLGSDEQNFAVSVALAAGQRWQVRVQYKDPGQVVSSTSKTVKLLIGAKPADRVALRSAHLGGTKVTVTGAVSPKAPKGGATVQLLAFKAGTRSPRFGVKATASIRSGRSTVTLHGTLGTGSRWVLELKYIVKGQAASYSGLDTVTVK
jgi:tungstate transport system substrate-binding protein